MKRITFLICALLMATTSLWAYDFEVDRMGYTKNSDSTTVTLTSSSLWNYSDFDGNVIIPEQVTYGETIYQVTAIGKSVFGSKFGGSLLSITMPNSITSIGDWAFGGCSSLTTVTLPEDLSSIGKYAFSGCTGLTSITFPDALSSIGEGAFRGCSGITTLIIPDNVTTIAKLGFQNCTGLTSISISSRITVLEAETFNGCIALTSVVVPDRVTTIKEKVFKDCSALTSITIGKRVNNIVFDSQWGDGAFGQCPNLREFIVHEENETYSSVDGLLCNKAGTQLHYYANARASDYTLPGSITSIGEFAFEGCIGEFSLTIPGSITSIGNKAFHGCDGLTSITLHDGITSIGKYAFGACRNLTSIILPDNITTIENYTFEDCSSLASVILPKELTSIGNNAFEWCTSLTSITIPNQVTKINMEAFKGCTALDSVVLGYKLETIGSQAFTQSPQIKKVYSLNPTPPTSVNEAVFASEVYNNATLYVPEGLYSTYSDADIWWKFLNIEECDLTKETHLLILKVNDKSMGDVKGDGEYENNAEVTIEAIPNSGYRFVQWSDGNTDNPRTLTMTEDMILIAEFEQITYQLSVQSNDESLGCVMGNSGSYQEGEEVIIAAFAQGGITFVQWSDGVTDNPRTIKMTGDCTLVAQFAQGNQDNEDDYQVTTSVNDVTLGSVSQSKAVVVEATPTDNAYFVQWSDGNTDNPRTIVLTEDVTLVAEFKAGNSIETLDATGIQIYTSEDAVYINQAPAGECIIVYDLSGRVVKSEEAMEGSTRIALDAGAYLVKVVNHVEKVVL